MRTPLGVVVIDRVFWCSWCGGLSIDGGDKFETPNEAPSPPTPRNAGDGR